MGVARGQIVHTDGFRTILQHILTPVERGCLFRAVDKDLCFAIVDRPKIKRATRFSLPVEPETDKQGEPYRLGHRFINVMRSCPQTLDCADEGQLGPDPGRESVLWPGGSARKSSPGDRLQETFIRSFDFQTLVSSWRFWPQRTINLRAVAAQRRARLPAIRVRLRHVGPQRPKPKARGVDVFGAS